MTIFSIISADRPIEFMLNQITHENPLDYLSSSLCSPAIVSGPAYVRAFVSRVKRLVEQGDLLACNKQV